MTEASRSLRAIRESIQNRTVSAVDLARQHLQRIRVQDQVPGEEINSFLSLSEERALAQAGAMSLLAGATPCPLWPGCRSASRMCWPCAALPPPQDLPS